MYGIMVHASLLVTILLHGFLVVHGRTRGCPLLAALRIPLICTVHRDLTNAKVLPEARPYVNRRIELDDNSPITSKCSPPERPATYDVRDVVQHAVDNTTSEVFDLVRRVMTLPNGNDFDSMNDFIIAEVDTATPIVWEGPRGDQNTALYQLFAGGAVSAGLDGLTGCTSLVILSRQGWFVTHYWESISFDPDEQWGFSDANDALQRSVLDPLMHGAGNANNPAHPSLSAVAGTFAGNSVRGFIVEPSKNVNEDRRGYQDAWDGIKRTVGQIIPGLDVDQHGDRWKEIKYRRLDATNRPALDKTAAAHVLVKYDPDHPAGTGGRKLTLWVEWDEIYNDEW